MLLLTFLAMAACSVEGAEEDGRSEGESCAPVPFDISLKQRGDIRLVHDPVLIKHEDRYTLFFTGPGIPMRQSEDLVQWSEAGRVFSELPAWTKPAVPDVEFPWAPDISFFNGRYHLYYALSTFGSQRSVIALATNETLDPANSAYAWTDRGEVVESRSSDDYNAIDPNVAFDAEGRPWLAWGSHWDGIKMRRLNAETGLPSEDDTTLYALAARPDDPQHAVEAPFIIRHDGYYYLFVSFDQCCNGAESTYKIMVGRAEAITGPYVDRGGTPMMQGGGTLVLTSYGRIRGPGHNAILSEDGRHFLVHHFYDKKEDGVSKLQVRPIVWGENDWPLAGASYNGNASVASSNEEWDMTGNWRHSVSFGSPVKIQLSKDGYAEQCDREGKWSLSGSRLVLRWPSADASGETWVERGVVAPDGSSYVGRNQDGAIVRGWRMSR